MSEEGMPYWLAFIALARDRQYDSLSLGMGGGVRLPCVIPREAIRREGKRQGYASDELDDFVEIVAGLDDGFIETETKRIAADTKAAATRMKKKG